MSGPFKTLILLTPLSSSGLDQAIILKLILYSFEMASGLKINFTKSSLIYLKQEQGKDLVLSAILNYKLESLPIKYLRLPLNNRGPARSDWLELIEKVERRLASWKGKLLSLGGRLTLINSVLSASLLISCQCLYFLLASSRELITFVSIFFGMDLQRYLVIIILSLEIKFASQKLLGT